MTYSVRSFSEDWLDLTGLNVLVTGGTGSFGRQFVRTVLDTYKVNKLIIFSRDELKQSEMAETLAGHKNGRSLRFFIGDVRDQNRLDMALRDVDVVVHAAAMKQVPTAEYNPFECIHTNVLGAEYLVGSAIRNGVTKLIALSTDKAANPINLYGASKLASDKIFVAANSLAGAGGTRFSVVRYGNVLGSRGSVVPFFRRLLKNGATSVPITHPDMTRFWVALGQGIGFVLSCLQLMKGGEIFVPKVPSMRVTDLAAAIAPGMPHDIVGIRPGEKIHEVLITEDDSRNTIETDDRLIITPAFPFWTDNDYGFAGSRPVADGFRYASDSNPEWLDRNGLLALLGTLD